MKGLFRVSLGAMLVFGCTQPLQSKSASQAPAADAPATGTVVSGTFYKAYGPAYRAGMKWVYAFTSDNPSFPMPPAPFSYEIIEVNGDQLKIKTSIGGPATVVDASAFDNPMQRTSPGASKEAGLEYTMLGEEDVTVAAGTYVKAAKIQSSFQGLVSTGWFVPGVGLVKSAMTTTIDGKTVTMGLELKEFVTAAEGAAVPFRLDEAFLRAHSARPVKGATRSYHQTMTHAAAQAPVPSKTEQSDRQEEVLAVSGDLSIVRVTRGENVSIETRDRLTNPLGGSGYSEMTYTLEGTEDITIGGVSYRGAKKVKATQGFLFETNETTGWFVPDLGLVKVERRMTGSTPYGIATMTALEELTAVSSPAAGEEVEPSTMKHGGRLTLNGTEVPLFGRLQVGSQHAGTDSVFISAEGSLDDSKQTVYNLRIELGPATKTVDGFSLDTATAKVRQFEVWSLQDGPSRKWSTYLSDASSLHLTRTQGKLAGRIVASAPTYEASGTVKQDEWALEFDIFPMHMSH